MPNIKNIHKITMGFSGIDAQITNRFFIKENKCLIFFCMNEFQHLEKSLDIRLKLLLEQHLICDTFRPLTST